MTRAMTRTTVAGLCALALLTGAAAPAWGQAAPADDDRLAPFRDPTRVPESVGAEAQIVDRRGEQVPLDAMFDDEQGKKVTLRELAGGRPILLQLAYFRCPGLCTFTLDGLVDTLRAMPWTPGEQFTVVVLSINPEETANLARLKKGAYLEELGRPEAAAGWHFLTGTTGSIRAVAEAVGFGFRFDTETREFAHGAGVFVLTPDGVVSRTITGAEYDPTLVRLSLVEASAGKVGSALDQILLFCYHFDPEAGQYTLQIMNIVRVLGSSLAVSLFGFVGFMLWRERRARSDRDSTPIPSLSEEEAPAHAGRADSASGGA